MAVVIMICSTLCGCEFLENLLNPFSANFAQNSINMLLGEDCEITFDDFKYKGNKNSVSFSLSTSDDDIIAISGHTLNAVGEGSATITARFSNNTTAKVEAYVSKSAQKLTLMSRDRSKSVVDSSAIEVYAIVNDGKVSATRYDIEWEVDGQKIEDYTGEVYVLPATATPVTKTVTAKIKNTDNSFVSDTVKINRYSAVENSPTLTVNQGSLTQSATSMDKVVFGYNYDLGANTAPVVEWKVNGETVEVDTQTFEFTPAEVGEYDISATINDATANRKVTVAGAVVPQNIKIDYDTNYPQVTVSWDGAKASGETFTVSIDGNETQVGENSFTFSASAYPLTSSHAIKIKSNGNGGVISESAYSETVITPQVTPTAISYLNTKWYDGNYYITSDEEFCDIYDYFMLFREQPEQGATSAEYKVYMAYNSAYSLASLVQMAFDRPNYTGKYNLGYRQSGSIVTLTFEFITLSTPTTIGTPEQNKQYNGVNPHVSATGEATLPIDSWTKTAQVVTTDQLYKVIEHGYKPLPVENSRAENYYNYAKTLLSKIIDDDMTDIQKAHAIYDWIMWRVVYDDNATSLNDLTQATAYGAFYIEGVLTNSAYTAVCDGMSKTYSLLANMCGLKCYRVVGEAKSSSTSPAGGHAWNKVLVDGEWYIVDCTWGDQRIGLTYSTGLISSSQIIRESASHDYFLKTDAQVASTHFEVKVANYPSTSVIPYNLYNETSELSIEDNNTIYSSYVVNESDFNAITSALANNMYSQFNYNSNRQKLYAVGGENYTSYFVMQEVMLSPLLYAKTETFASAIKTQVVAKGMSCSVVIENNKITVFASKQYRIQ